MKALILLAALLLAPAADDAVDTDRDRMQGRWRMTGGERDGRPLPAEQFKAERVIEVKGDRWIAHRPERPRDADAATMKLDPGKKPKWIDLTGPYRGPYRGPEPQPDVTMLGLYELDGDVLRICFAGPGETERPTAFRSEEGKMAILVFERVKEPGE